MSHHFDFIRPVNRQTCVAVGAVCTSLIALLSSNLLAETEPVTDAEPARSFRLFGQTEHAHTDRKVDLVETVSSDADPQNRSEARKPRRHTLKWQYNGVLKSRKLHSDSEEQYILLSGIPFVAGSELKGWGVLSPDEQGRLQLIHGDTVVRVVKPGQFL